MTGIPSRLSTEQLLNNRIAALIEQDEIAMEACTDLAAALFRFYAVLRAERFTAGEAEHALNIFCATTTEKYARGLIPPMEGS